MYHIEESPNSMEDRKKIDFRVRDENDNWVAEAWGDSEEDLEIDCSHDDIEFNDECSYCKICGVSCSWHEEESWEDDGHDENGNCCGHICRVKVVDEWHNDVRILNNVISNHIKEV